MNIKRLVNSPTGRIIISIILGIGLASLFYKVCKDKDCIHFHGPVIKQVDGKIFEYENKCFKYDAVPVTCNEDKKTLSFAENFNIGTLEIPTKNPKVSFNESL
jgi:hypothetical protein